jgi:hypothetical protein
MFAAAQFTINQLLVSIKLNPLNFVVYVKRGLPKGSKDSLQIC